MENYVNSRSKLHFKRWFLNSSLFSKDNVNTGARNSSRVNNYFLRLFCYCFLVIRQDRRWSAGLQNIFSTCQVHKAGLLFLPQCSYDSSISPMWTPHVIYLSDRNDPLWEYWYNLSNLTNQRVYQELVYLNKPFKEMITGYAALSLPSFLPFLFCFVFVFCFFFHVRAFSIQQTRLSRLRARLGCIWKKI